jgi:hypothetical protein
VGEDMPVEDDRGLLVPDTTAFENMFVPDGEPLDRLSFGSSVDDGSEVGNTVSVRRLLGLFGSVITFVVGLAVDWVAEVTWAPLL